GYFLNPKYNYKARLGEDQTGEVKDGLYECLERMVPDEMQQLEVHQQISFFSKTTGTFGKNLAKIARDVDQSIPRASDAFKNPNAILLKAYTKRVTTFFHARLNKGIFK
ncbi:hypothetical protein KI387_001506, partial [Taxus chinensis]